MKKVAIFGFAVTVFMMGTRLQMREAYSRPMLVKQGTFWRASISSASSCSVAVVSVSFLMSNLGYSTSSLSIEEFLSSKKTAKIKNLKFLVSY
jgi:hypothetical protein